MADRLHSSDLDTATFRTFAAACASAVRGAPAPSLPDGVEPIALIELAVRHRIAAPVLERLAEAARSADPVAGEVLAARARRHRLAALERTRRLVALSRALSGEGIRHLAVKGNALAEQLYGDVAARDSKDIDLLIDPAAVAASARLLDRLGYRAETEPGRSAGEDGFKHFTVRSGAIEVEVHSRLLDMVDFVPLPFDELWERRAAVRLAGAVVPTTSPVDGLAYLCAHGSEHCWFRLKWLQDIARIIVVDDGAVLREAVAMAQRGGYDRMLAAMVELVDELFGIAPVERPPLDRAARRFVALSRTALAAPADLASDPTLGWLVRRSRAQLGLRRRWPDRAAYLRHLFTSPRSFESDEEDRRWVGRPARLLRHHYARSRRRG